MNKADERDRKILETKRFKRTYRGENIYVSVSYYNKEPIEIFVKFAIQGLVENEYMEAGWDALTRILSVSSVKTEDVIKHLKRASRRHDDIPAIIVSVLEEFMEVMNG